MTTIDTRTPLPYSPLIPAMKAICRAQKGETLEIVMNDEEAFCDLKEYLSEQNTPFREIYHGESDMTLQFLVAEQ